MTVCVAAICSPTTIVGASDRMLTAGDVQFERKAPKIYPLSNSIAVMTAGDSSLQAEILHDVFADVGERIRSFPQEWVEVRWAASRCFPSAEVGHFRGLS